MPDPIRIRNTGPKHVCCPKTQRSFVTVKTKINVVFADFDTGMAYVYPCCVAATGVEGSVLRSKQNNIEINTKILCIRLNGYGKY